MVSAFIHGPTFSVSTISCLEPGNGGTALTTKARTVTHGDGKERTLDGIRVAERPRAAQLSLDCDARQKLLCSLRL